MSKAACEETGVELRRPSGATASNLEDRMVALTRAGCHRWPKALFWMHFEGGGDGFTDGLEAKDIRQDFKISVQQLKGWGGGTTGKHASWEERGQPGVWGTSGSRCSIRTSKRRWWAGRWTCRSGVNTESSAYRWHLKSQKTGWDYRRSGIDRKDDSLEITALGTMYRDRRWGGMSKGEWKRIPTMF